MNKEEGKKKGVDCYECVMDYVSILRLINTFSNAPHALTSTFWVIYFSNKP